MNDLERTQEKQWLTRVLDEAAARVVGLKQRALAQQRLVDGHFAVVNRDGNGNVAGERRVQIHRGARADRLHIRQRRELLHPQPPARHQSAAEALVPHAATAAGAAA